MSPKEVKCEVCGIKLAKYKCAACGRDACTTCFWLQMGICSKCGRKK